MPAVYGGSMAVASGSHEAEWRFDAYRALHQDRTVDGGLTRDEFLDVFAVENQNNTCNLPQSDPELRSRIEETKKVFDKRKGDVIFADRLLFHRTIAMADEGIDYFQQLSKDVLTRYSIRYIPGLAKLPSGFNFEESVAFNPDNAGRSLNEVAMNDAWYPQVWPVLNDDADARLEEMARTKYGQARQILKEAIEEFFTDVQMRKAAAGKKVREEGAG